MAARVSRLPKGVAKAIAEISERDQSPALIFSLPVLEKNMRRLQTLSQKYDVQFLMAVKSFPFKQVLSKAGKTLAGYDVSNAHELGLVSTRTGWLWFTNPTGQTLAPAVYKQRGLKLVTTLESVKSAQNFVLKHPSSLFALRLNPAILLNADASMSRFGIELQDLLRPSAAKLFSHAHFQGFHLHQGGEQNRPEHYWAFARRIFKVCRQHQIPLPAINFGGGLNALDWPEIEKLVSHLRRILPAEVKIFFEPGKLLARDAGFALAKICQRRKIGASETIVTDLSRNCHLNWSEPRALNRQGSLAKIFGPTCFEGDFIELAPVGPKARYIVFRNVNGYSATWNRSFNGVPQAEVRFVE